MKNRVFLSWAISLIAAVTLLLGSSVLDAPTSRITSVPVSDSHQRLLIDTTFKVTVTNADGTVASEYTRPSDSYVGNFIDILFAQFQNSYLGTSARATNGSYYSINPYTNNYNTLAIAGDTTQHIVVGTGSTAVTLGDYVMGTPIANGTGAGQMLYGAGTLTAPSTVGSTRSFGIIRAFTNLSGSTITVNELGVISFGREATPSNKLFLIIRDVIGGGQAVNSGQTLTITYTISVTV